MLQILKKPAKSFLYPVMFPKWKLRENEYNSRLATSGKKNKNWPCYISTFLISKFQEKNLRQIIYAALKYLGRGLSFCFEWGCCPQVSKILTDTSWKISPTWSNWFQLQNLTHTQVQEESEFCQSLDLTETAKFSRVSQEILTDSFGYSTILGEFFFQVDALERSICVTRQEIASFSRPATFALLQNDH